MHCLNWQHTSDCVYHFSKHYTVFQTRKTTKVKALWTPTLSCACPLRLCYYLCLLHSCPTTICCSCTMISGLPLQTSALYRYISTMPPTYISLRSSPCTADHEISSLSPLLCCQPLPYCFLMTLYEFRQRTVEEMNISLISMHFTK